MKIIFDTQEEILARDIPNMSENLKIQFLKIANELSKKHKENYTEERVLATYMLVAHLYQEIEKSRQ